MADVGGGDAQIRRTRTVDHHPHLRPGFLVIRIRPHEPGIACHLGQHDVAPAGQFFVIGPTQDQLEWLPARAHQPTTGLRAYFHPGKPGKFLFQLGRQFHRTFAALIPGLQKHHGPPGMHFFAGPETARHPWVGAQDGFIGADVFGQNGFDFFHLPHGVIKARAFRTFHHQLEGPAIFRRCQLGGQQFEQGHQRNDRCQQQAGKQPDPMHIAPQYAAVATGQPLEPGIQPLAHLVFMHRMRAGMRAQQFAGHHRGQGQRYKGRNGHRRRQCHRQFAK